MLVETLVPNFVEGDRQKDLYVEFSSVLLLFSPLARPLFPLFDACGVESCRPGLLQELFPERLAPRGDLDLAFWR